MLITLVNRKIVIVIYFAVIGERTLFTRRMDDLPLSVRDFANHESASCNLACMHAWLLLSW